MNFQPPDPPDEGYCPRCKTFIHRDELLQDGCIECEDLLINDMKTLWAGRPKPNGVYRFRCYLTCMGGTIVDFL